LCLASELFSSRFLYVQLQCGPELQTCTSLRMLPSTKRVSRRAIKNIILSPTLKKEHFPSNASRARCMHAQNPNSAAMTRAECVNHVVAARKFQPWIGSSSLARARLVLFSAENCREEELLGDPCAWQRILIGRWTSSSPDAVSPNAEVTRIGTVVDARLARHW
jgi:hypothetical protein